MQRFLPWRYMYNWVELGSTECNELVRKSNGSFKWTKPGTTGQQKTESLIIPPIQCAHWNPREQKTVVMVTEVWLPLLSIHYKLWPQPLLTNSAQQSHSSLWDPLDCKIRWGNYHCPNQVLKPYFPPSYWEINKQKYSFFLKSYLW